MTSPADDARWNAIAHTMTQPFNNALAAAARAMKDIILNTIQRRVYQTANAQNVVDYFYTSFQPCVEVNPEYCVDHHLHEPWYG